MTANKITVGDQLPNFEAKDQDGNLIKSDDFEGYPLVLLFFSHDSSLEGIKLLQLYNDYLGEFADFEAVVVGVSPDNADSHLRMMHKHNLRFPLIVDQNMELARLFDVVIKDETTNKSKITPTTFVVDWNKTVCWLEKQIKLENHLDRLIQALDEYCG